MSAWLLFGIPGQHRGSDVIHVVYVVYVPHPGCGAEFGGGRAGVRGPGVSQTLIVTRWRRRSGGRLGDAGVLGTGGQQPPVFIVIRVIAEIILSGPAHDRPTCRKTTRCMMGLKTEEDIVYIFFTYLLYISSFLFHLLSRLMLIVTFIGLLHPSIFPFIHHLSCFSPQTCQSVTPFFLTSF